MSIIISNINIPPGCQKCKFFKKHAFGNGLDYSYSCILGAKDFPMPWIRQMEERASDCPIEILEQRSILDKKGITRQKPDPCNFCSIIYPDDDRNDIVFRKGKYSDVDIDSFITIDKEGKYYVNIDPGDPYELGYLDDIKFCPYCGRKLAESEEKT